MVPQLRACEARRRPNDLNRNRPQNSIQRARPRPSVELQVLQLAPNRNAVGGCDRVSAASS
jgi:hypothetical protein